MKWLLFMTLCLVSFSSKSQSKDYTESKFTYTDIVKLDSQQKADLFSNAMRWANESFKSSKNVIQYSDKEDGKILIKGALKLSLPADDWVYFTAEIMIKKGAYKYIFKDFYHEGYTEGGKRNAGSLLNDNPDCGHGRMTGRYWGKIKTETNREIEILIELLKQKMKEKSESF